MLKTQRRIISNPREDILLTEVRLSGVVAEIRIEVREKLNSRQRRTIVNSFFRHMQPWLDYFHEGTLQHEGSGFPDLNRDLQRMDRWMKQRLENIPIEDQAIGVGIRLRRLELGYTQAELAQRARVSRSQLVEIEKGTRKPRNSTLFRLSSALGVAPPSRTQSDMSGIDPQGVNPENRAH